MSSNLELSIVIQAHNDVAVIENTLLSLHSRLEKEQLAFELEVVNDNSSDGTTELLDQLRTVYPNIRCIDNNLPNGFGFAVRCGKEAAVRKYVAIVMADASDADDDVVRFFRIAEQEGLDAEFGNRFSKGGVVVDYLLLKLCFNRLTNWIIALLFAIRYTDTTNAFKLYRQDTLEGLKPYRAITLTLQLNYPEGVVCGYSYGILPNRWTNRKFGESKHKIKEMGSRYWFIILYCLIEKWLSVGDYRK